MRPIPAQSSVLDAKALGRLIQSKYRIRPPISCRFFRKGMTDAYEVKSPAGDYFLKVYMHGRRSRADIEDEVRLLNYLNGRGVPVVKVVRIKAGGYVIPLKAPEGERYAVLFRAVRGPDADCGNPKCWAAIGRSAAHLHKAADAANLRLRRKHIGLEHLVDESLETIRPFMARRPADFALIRSIGIAAKERVRYLLPYRLPEYGICHGDLHGGDARMDSRGRAILFDFDSFGYGWRALDLGTFYASDEWMATTPKREAVRRRRFRHFVKGYGSVRKLSPAEAEVAVRCGPPIRHIYLMGAVLKYWSRYEGFHFANANFFDWHLAWFRHWARKGEKDP